MTEAIIFDMDGLMLDTEKIALESWRKAGEDYGYDITKELMMQVIGSTVVDTRKFFVKNMGEEFPFEEIREVTIKYRNEYIEINGVPIKKGLIEFLEYSKSQDIPMVVATSTNRSEAIELLKRASIFEYFENIICGNEVEKGKPEPDIFLLASKKLGVEPKKCIVLEDSERGILAASRAKMIPIWIPDLIKESNIAKENAEYICDSLLEAKELLREIR